MRLLLDENISPTLVHRSWEQRIDTLHVRAPDHVIWEFALSEKRAVVTIKGREFLALAKRASIHHGVVVIPSGSFRGKMFAYIIAAIEWAKTRSTEPINFYQQFVTVNAEFEISAEAIFDQTLLRGEVPDVTRLYLA